MGTIVTFDLFDERGFHEDAVYQAFKDAASILHAIDEIFSTWKPESPMSRLRRGDIDVVSAPPEVGIVLEQCRIAKEVSGGWFDPWALPGGVDPTGYVKGWAAQSALAMLEKLSARGAIVNAAGDVAVAGQPSGESPFRVGVINPFSTSSLACVVEVFGAIATSGDYERGAHLLNPFTGELTTALASATVCGPDLALADALATALAVGGDEVLDRIGALDAYEAFAIERDGTWKMTEGFTLSSEVAL